MRAVALAAVALFQSVYSQAPLHGDTCLSEESAFQTRTSRRFRQVGFWNAFLKPMCKSLPGFGAEFPKQTVKNSASSPVTWLNRIQTDHIPSPLSTTWLVFYTWDKVPAVPAKDRGLTMCMFIANRTSWLLMLPSQSIHLTSSGARIFILFCVCMGPGKTVEVAKCRINITNWI